MMISMIYIHNTLSGYVIRYVKFDLDFVYDFYITYPDSVVIPIVIVIPYYSK